LEYRISGKGGISNGENIMVTQVPGAAASIIKNYSGKKILVIDDNIFLSDVISKALTKYLSIDVAKANNGGEGIASALSGIYDGVIIDLSLNSPSSAKIIKTIKTMLPKLPVAVMYSHFADEMLTWLEQNGVTLMLHKPFKITSLIEKITTMLGAVDNSPAQNRSITVEE
jgi:DNA-binding NtrC family response regulator